MKNFKFGLIALLSMITFLACNPVNTHAQNAIALKSDGNSAYIDTITNAGTESFSITDFKTLLPGVEGKYRLHFDATNISGTSTFKVVVHSKSNSSASAGYSLHHKNAGTDGVNCDTLQVTSGSPAAFDFNLAPGVVSHATENNTSNAGRILGLKVYFIGTGTQSTQIKNVSLLIQK